MPTEEEIRDSIERLNERWESPRTRNELFGNAIRTIELQGIRGLNVGVEFSWPVVAIAGVNGSGKTTLLQVASTAYSRAQGGRYYKLGDWIRNELVGDTPPVALDARVAFSFWDDSPRIPVPYQPANSRWRYPRRGNPQRYVEFVGIANFAPRIELKDRVHVFRSRLEIRQSEALSDNAVRSLTAITGRPYEAGQVHTVGTANGNWTQYLPQLRRHGVTYSEPHMGAGEQKIVRLIRQLESIPRQSLIVLEEPELTLHPDAQRGLAWYLMNLAGRKGHQVLIATHSPDIFETLPRPARILLLRGPQGSIEAVHNAQYLFAARELAANVRMNKDLVLVEDTVGRQLLREIMRRYDRALLEHCQIVPVGNTDDVRRLVESFRNQGVRAVGVRDADIGAHAAIGLLSLPGNRSPEELLVEPENITRTEQLVNGIVAAYDYAVVSALGLQGSRRAKRILSVLHQRVGLTEDQLADRLTWAWIEAHEQQARDLVHEITNLLAA